jgi:hypothetical protein
MKRAAWMALAFLVAPPALEQCPLAPIVPGPDARVIGCGNARVYARGADDPAGGARKPLTVVNESGKSLALTDAAWKKLPRQTVKAKDHSGTLATYEGVPLATILQEDGVALGKELRGERLANCLLVEAADGYRVAFSLAEIDPAMSEGVVLLADSKDGQALDEKEGPYRLVVPHDKRYSRWVRQVIRLSVQRLAEPKDRPKDG